MRKTILIIIISLFALGGIGYFAMSINYTNQEVDLRESIEIKKKDLEANYTKMWEIITQKAGVSKEYAKQFKEIYTPLIQGRYSNDKNSLMKWIQEHNPTFDTSLYLEVTKAIEAQRENFHMTQKQLLAMSREHNILLKSIPSKWFLDVESIEITIVVNDAAEKAFKTGKEQPMKLY